MFTGIAAVAAVVTAAGVGFGASQVRLAKQQLEHMKQQAQTDFEDGLVREYRALIEHLPPHAFFRHQCENLSDDELRAFFRYFDLCNEQLWLVDQGRVREQTIEEWRDGMVENLRLPAFRRAWEEISPNLAPGYWERLRGLIRERLEPA